MVEMVLPDAMPTYVRRKHDPPDFLVDRLTAGGLGCKPPVQGRGWITTRGSPSLTTSASTGISIFIDSRITTGSVGATCCPISTSTVSTAATSSATTVWVMGSRVGVRTGCFRYADACEPRGRPDLSQVRTSPSVLGVRGGLRRGAGRRLRRPGDGRRVRDLPAQPG